MYIQTQKSPEIGLGQAAAIPSVPVRIPNLLWSENQPPGTTLYVDIDLNINKAVKPLTGIFCPDRYRLNLTTDIVVYLHGHNDKAQCFEPAGVVPIDKYWKRRTFRLREEVNDSGKNIILVAPTLGQISESEVGDLVKPGGFDNFLNQVRAALIAYGPYKGARYWPMIRKNLPMIGNIILASHSGGGNPMLNIASGGDRYAANIQECWCFDCLYADKDGRDKWIQWARPNQDPKKNKWLFVYFKGSTKVQSNSLKAEAIKRNSNVVVQESEACCHCCVPIIHFREHLRNASFLSDR